MKPKPITEAYLESMALLLGTDAHIIKAMVNTKRCRPLTGNKLFDLREIDDGLRKYQREMTTNWYSR